MKRIYILSIGLLGLLTACNTGKAEAQQNKSATAKTEISKVQPAQKEQEIDLLKPLIENGVILGQFDPVLLEAAPYSNWYNASYNRANLDQNKLKQVKAALKDVEVTAFVGTWCGDTKRDFPEFMRIMDEVKFDRDKIKVYGMNRGYRNTDLAKEWKIGNVPTFIFYRKGKEIGRYIEYPEISVLDDMLNILTK